MEGEKACDGDQACVLVWAEWFADESGVFAFDGSTFDKAVLVEG